VGRLLHGLGQRRARRREQSAGRAGFEKCPSSEATRVLFPRISCTPAPGGYLPIIRSSVGIAARLGNEAFSAVLVFLVVVP